jgi:hypothetical protein
VTIIEFRSKFDAPTLWRMSHGIRGKILHRLLEPEGISHHDLRPRCDG